MSASISPSKSPSASPSASPSQWLENPRFILVDSPYIVAGGEVTTTQLTAPVGKASGTHFQAGRIQDDENPADIIDLTGNKYTEIEWCVKATDEAEIDATYQFRVTKWSPLDISGCIIWLRSDLGAYTDAAKTILCGNNDLIYTGADQSGNGYDFIQTTDTKRPTYVMVQLDGYPAWRFDGIDDFLKNTTANMVFTNFTMIIVSNIITTQAYQGYWWVNPDYGLYCPGSPPTDGKLYFTSLPGNYNLDGQPGTAPHIITARHEANVKSNLFVDGDLVFQDLGVTESIANATKIIFPVHPNEVSYPANMNFYEMFLFNKAISDVDHALILNYAAARYPSI